MPMYVFTNPKTGENFDKYLSYDDFDLLYRNDSGAKVYVIDDGTECELNLSEQLVKTNVENTEIWNGMKSRALGVHPSQVKEDQENAKKHGVNVTHDRMGNPVFSSRKNRMEYCKYRGAVDYEGGFSDNT